MRQFTLSLSLALVVLLGLVVSGIRTRAEEATPAAMDMATHPVVGTWELTGELPDFTFPILATFHAGGTYHEVYP
jgi:hypothetical protein